MDSILHGLNWKDCLIYLDDVIIFAKNLEELNRQLDAVLERLEDAGVKLNAAKCQFLQEEPPSWEKVSREGVTTDPEKTKVVLQYPEPSDVASLRAFFRVCRLLQTFRIEFRRNCRTLVQPGKERNSLSLD